MCCFGYANVPHVIFKVMNCEISFQDLEKVLNLAKINC